MNRTTFLYKSASLLIDVIYMRKPAEKGNHMQEYVLLGIFSNNLVLLSEEIHREDKRLSMGKESGSMSAIVIVSFVQN